MNNNNRNNNIEHLYLKSRDSHIFKELLSKKLLYPVLIRNSVTIRSTRNSQTISNVKEGNLACNASDDIVTELKKIFLKTVQFNLYNRKL